jgi:hypothetical protein
VRGRARERTRRGNSTAATKTSAAGSRPRRAAQSEGAGHLAMGGRGVRGYAHRENGTRAQGGNPSWASRERGTRVGAGALAGRSGRPHGAGRYAEGNGMTSRGLRSDVGGRSSTAGVATWELPGRWARLERRSSVAAEEEREQNRHRGWEEQRRRVDRGAGARERRGSTTSLRDVAAMGGRAGAERALESRSAERTDRELRAEQCAGSRARCSARSWGMRELGWGEGRRAGAGTRGVVEKKLRAG